MCEAGERECVEEVRQKRKQCGIFLNKKKEMFLNIMQKHKSLKITQKLPNLLNIMFTLIFSQVCARPAGAAAQNGIYGACPIIFIEFVTAHTAYNNKLIGVGGEGTAMQPKVCLFLVIRICNRA